MASSRSEMTRGPSRRRADHDGRDRRIPHGRQAASRRSADRDLLGERPGANLPQRHRWRARFWEARRGSSPSTTARDHSRSDDRYADHVGRQRRPDQAGAGTLRFTEVNPIRGATHVQSGKLWLEPPAGGKALAGRCTSVDRRSPPASTCGSPRRHRGHLARCGPGARRVVDQHDDAGSDRPADVLKGGEVVVGGILPHGAPGDAGIDDGRRRRLLDSLGSTLEVTTTFKAFQRQETAVISGGNLVLGGARTFDVRNGPAPIDLRISSNILGGATARAEEGRAPALRSSREQTRMAAPTAIRQARCSSMASSLPARSR